MNFEDHISMFNQCKYTELYCDIYKDFYKEIVQKIGQAFHPEIIYQFHIENQDFANPKISIFFKFSVNLSDEILPFANL